MKKLININKDNIKNHFHYGRYYYIASIVLIFILVNAAYTVTMPRIPKENKVSIMMYAGFANEPIIEEWEAEMLSMLPSDQRMVDIVSTLPIGVGMEAAVVARMAANEDDVLVIEYANMQGYVDGGAFIPLDEYLDLDSIIKMYPELDWSKYFYIHEQLGDTEPHIYTIPLYGIVDIEDIKLIGENLCIAVLNHSVNIDNSVTCLEYIVAKISEQDK